MKKSFSLVEFLVVIAIVGILAVIIFPYYFSARKQLALQRAASQLALDIRKVQGMAMSSEEYSDCSGTIGYKYGYGIFLQQNKPEQYILFADCNGDGNYSSGEDEIIVGGDVGFETGIEINSLSSNNLKIAFTPPEPIVTFIPSSVNIAIIELINEQGQTKTIKVNKAGLIFIE